MTITIPTSEFTGLLGDVLPFAFPKNDLPELNCVRVEWDGERLHAFAHDTNRAGWCRWHPEDMTGDEERQDALFESWGGADEPWAVVLPYDDAKKAVEVFKLPPKEGWVPLTVECRFGALKVQRAKDTGYSSIIQVITGRLHEFGDLRAVLDVEPDRTELPSIAFDGRALADFGKVRQHGPMELVWTGEHTKALVRIGDRFRGCIRPAEIKGREPALATASGVHLGGGR